MSVTDEDLAFVKDAIKDFNAGKMSAESCIVVIQMILFPPPVTEDDIKWARSELERLGR